MKITAMMAMLLAGCGSGGVDGPTLVGPEGPQGPPGPQGERGPAGPAGTNGATQIPHLFLAATAEDLGPAIGVSASFYPAVNGPVRWQQTTTTAYAQPNCAAGDQALVVRPAWGIAENEWIVDPTRGTLVHAGKPLPDFAAQSVLSDGNCSAWVGDGTAVTFHEILDSKVPAVQHFSLELSIELR